MQQMFIEHLLHLLKATFPYSRGELNSYCVFGPGLVSGFFVCNWG